MIWILVGSITPGLATEKAEFPRYPSISPDGSEITFSYGGDIWTVPSEGGRAHRLTVHPAYEYYPRWSPDGRWIAFSANRHGDDDIYIIPAAGGKSARLTFQEMDDRVCDWMSDSGHIIFSSRRDDRYPDYKMLYSVSIDGGTPLPIMEAFGSQTAVSADGKEILYVRDGVHWWRRHYRGSAAGQVWRYSLDSGEHTAITDTLEKLSGEDYRTPSSIHPLYGSNGSIHITSDHDGTFNIWKREPSGSWKQITTYQGDGVRFPSISRDGRTIAYEQDLSIYVIKGDSDPRELEIKAPLDDPSIETEIVHYDNKAVRLDFTPDGKQMFIEVRGEVFAGRIVDDDVKAARGRANSLSGGLPARDGDFTVSPGGDSLVFVSDRDGNRELYLVYSDDPEMSELARAMRLKLERLTDNPTDEHTPRWSPVGNHLAFIRGKGDLVIRDMKKGEERILLTGWSMLQYEWSPDGQWIAYAREDNEYNSDVYIIPAAGGEPINISRHPDEDDRPIWSTDGRKLGFRSRRRSNNWDIYFVFLRLEDHQKSLADWAEEAIAKADEKKSDNDKKKKKDDKSEIAAVEIDTTELHRRVRPVTVLAGEEGEFVISPDGEKFAFTANHEGEIDLYIIKWTGEDIERLTKGGTEPKSISFSSDGKRIRFLTKNGRIKSVKADGGKEKNHPFDAYIRVDRLAERYQKFNEVWRGLGDRFYDPDFHGQDWKALHDKYFSLIPSTSCEGDFADLVRMMMGELNASHMGYSSPESGGKHRVGLLGLDFDASDTGPGLLIKHVLKHGPCDRGGVQVEPGERLIRVNGREITSNTNLNEILDNQDNQRVELILLKGKKERSVIVKPFNHWVIGRLRYDEWVDGRRAMVDSLSSGRLGYLHIKGMGGGSLARFEAQLYSVGAGKDGLVVDVRYNSGGWITDQLLAMLQVKRHAVTYPRDGGPGYPQGRLPLYSWTKPITVLCNKHSFSNAEIFSHAIKTLKRGTLIGEPTPGGVISTSWEPLLDGSSFRIPLRGWYTGTKPERDTARDMEGNGAVPDLIIPMLPCQMAAGDDLQIRAAVDKLMSRLEEKSD